MKVLRAADHKTMPWKNGLGSTTEIAISPAGATLDDFHWRVSMAQVGADGPFSQFDHIDRTLLLLHGNGLVLSVAGQQPLRIDSHSVHSFPGDVATSAELIDGPITDLNVMSRRGVVSHRVQRLMVLAPLAIPLAAETLVIVEDGVLDVQYGTADAMLRRHDAVWLDAGAVAATLRGAPQARLIMAQFCSACDTRHRF